MKKIISNIKRLFKTRHSGVLSIYGSSYEFSIHKIKKIIEYEDFLIISVSITRVDSQGGRGYVDDYMCLISYDYWV